MVLEIGMAVYGSLGTRIINLKGQEAKWHSLQASLKSTCIENAFRNFSAVLKCILKDVCALSHWVFAFCPCVLYKEFWRGCNFADGRPPIFIYGTMPMGYL